MGAASGLRDPHPRRHAFHREGGAVGRGKAGRSHAGPEASPASGRGLGWDGTRPPCLLADLAGRAMQQKTVNITKGTQVEKVNLNANSAKGVYLVKVLNPGGEVIIKEKIVVQ